VQERGALTALLTDGAVVNTQGKMKVVITPEIACNIFRLYPAVKQAYNDNVPVSMSESEFWTKYFLSEYYNRGKGESAYSKSRQTDDMFQRYETEMSVAAAAGTAGGGGKAPARHVNQDVDLISTYNDYHGTEQLESYDVPTDTSANPIVNKYIRNTNLIVNSIVRGKDSGKVETEEGEGGYPELMQEKPPAFIEMPHLHARPDGAVEPDDAAWQRGAKRPRLDDKISVSSVIAGMNTIFQDLGSSDHINTSKVHAQDQELYIKILQFPPGFRQVCAHLRTHLNLHEYF
jgi:hypothetical protein